MLPQVLGCAGVTPPHLQVPGSSSIASTKPGAKKSRDHRTSLGAKLVASHSSPSSLPPGDAKEEMKDPSLFFTRTICPSPFLPRYSRSPTPAETPLMSPSTFPEASLGVIAPSGAPARV